jgi:integrase
LRAALDAAPRTGKTILVSAVGRPYASANSLSNAIRKELYKLGLKQKGDGRKRLTMHGLRKNAASEVAALLVGTAGIKSVTGHKSDSMADYYAKHADQVAMNANVVEKWNAALARQGAEREAARKVEARRASIKRVA